MRRLLLFTLFSWPAFLFGAGKPDSNKISIPIDPKPRIIYQYGPNGRFGINALPTPGQAGIKQLTYSTDGRTNMGVVKVDGQVMEIGSAVGRWLAPPTFKKGKSGKKFLSRATWICPPALALTQILDIVLSQQPVEVARGKMKHLLDTCLVIYILENRDKKTHRVGLRLEIDTLIGTNDGVPFTVPGFPGLIDQQQDFPYADRVPEFIQALEVPDLKNPGTVARMNLKVGRGVEPPGRVSLTHWTFGYKGWDVPLKNMDRDSSIILYWEEKDLKPREKRMIGFSYGLGRITTQEGKLGLTVAGLFEKGNSFAAVATLTNPQPGVTLTLGLPSELERIGGKETEPVPATSKGPGLVTWRIRAKKVGQFKLEVRSSNGLGAAQTITITEPQPLLTPLLGNSKK